MTIRSDDLPRIQARNTAHANDINRRITQWAGILRPVYPYATEEEILRLAAAYVADEETHPAPWETK